MVGKGGGVIFCWFAKTRREKIEGKEREKVKLGEGERGREKERESEREYKGKILVRESILANHTYCFVIQYPC